MASVIREAIQVRSVGAHVSIAANIIIGVKMLSQRCSTERPAEKANKAQNNKEKKKKKAKKATESSEKLRQRNLILISLRKSLQRRRPLELGSQEQKWIFQRKISISKSVR